MILACPLISVFGNAKYLFTAKFSLFSNKMLFFRVGIHKMLVKLAIREDPDHTARLLPQKSDLGLPCSTRYFQQATSAQNFRTFMVNLV